MSFRVSCLFLSLLSVPALLAQGDRAAFNGSITDVTGSAVPNATVVALETQTGVETKATTTEAGVYRMPYLPLGTYKITVGAPGFKTAVAENVQLRVGQTLTVDFKLELGQVTENITVTAETPLLETGTAEIGRYVTEKEFDTWPVIVGDGRRQIQSFIFRSLPGTVGGEFQGSINGGQQYSHEILIEGMSLGRFDLQGGSNNEMSPSAEAVSEFKMHTGAIGAQYGGGQTAVANFAIRSGTNDLHGTVYDYLQNDVLRANSFTNNARGLKRPPFKLNNYGFSVGGPVYIPKLYSGRNRTFFFASYEATRQRDFNSTASGTLPTREFKAGDFSRLLNPAYTGDPRSGTVVGTDPLGREIRFGQIFDPGSTRTVGGQVVRDPFVGNIIPQNRFSTVSRNILGVGITDPVTDTLFNNIPVLSACCPVFDEKMLTLKGDHQISGAQRLSIYYSMNDRKRNNSPGRRWGSPPGLPTGVYQLQNTPGKMARVSHDWTLTPSILNHFAVGYNRFGNFNESVFVDEDWASQIGLQNTAATTFPALVFTGQQILGGNIGADNGSGTGRLGSESRGFSFNGSTIFQDDMTLIRGKHNFRVGFEQRFYYYNTNNKSGTGRFDFNSLQTQLPGFNDSTGHAFASFLLGEVASTSRAIALTNPGHRTRHTAVYFADDWKITDKLTLNMGLRWEIVGGIYEVVGRMSNLDPDMPNPAAGGRAGALVFAEDYDRKGFQSRNWLQLGPRFGFAYAVTNKIVARGGYSINNMPPVANFSLPSTFGYNGDISRTTANTALPYPQAAVFNLDQPYPNFAGTLPNKDPGLANGLGVTYVAPDSNRLGYQQNYSFGLQFQIPADFVLETSFIGNKGTRLVSRGLDRMNQLPVEALSFGDALIQPLSSNPGLAPSPYAGFTGTLAQALRRFPQYQDVSQYLPNFGQSWYNSLQVTATRHFKDGLSILAAYTFSKAITDVESPIDSYAAQDVYNRRLEKSVASFNVPQFFKFTWIYELPWGPGKPLNIGGIAGNIIGGWTATGIHNYRSGDALQISTGGFRTDALFNGTIRPDLVTGVPIVLESDAAVQIVGTGGGQYLNPAAFAQPPRTANGVPLRLGTAPRFLPDVRGPASYSEDLGLSKRFNFTESMNLEFRAEAFNVFNRAVPGNPELNITNAATFGRITSIRSGPRSLQLALRFAF
ncbi:MAG TPA: carboxypeptidase regulatory-like domain-containing protein [Bryobacteraceae bacterium]|nr:carboxypeptidase regulatory-like domain-containing protein [Bryobacteraceae bacterium]